MRQSIKPKIIWKNKTSSPPPNHPTFHPKGTYLIHGLCDAPAQVVNAADGKPIAEIDTGEDLDFFRFSPDGTTMTPCGRNKETHIYDTKTWKVRVTLPVGANHLAYSPSGRHIAIATGKAPIIFDVSTGKPVFQLAPSRLKVELIDYSPDGNLLATGPGKETNVWDARTGKKLAGLMNKNDIGKLVFSPDSQLLANCGDGNRATLWSLQKQTALHLPHEEYVCDVDFSPDGKLLASGAGDKLLRIWNTGTGQLAKELSGAKDWISSVEFSPDGKWLASTTWNTLHLWDTERGECVAKWSYAQWLPQQPFAWAPDSKRFVVATPSALILYSLT